MKRQIKLIVKMVIVILLGIVVGVYVGINALGTLIFVICSLFVKNLLKD